MWPDNETSNDLLGFQVHADLVRAVVTNPKMLPTIIGIFGDWGGGKTSIMKMLERDLDAEQYVEGSKERAAYEKVDREESDGLVKDYLEKVIQVPYHLPRLSAAEIESYMVLLFCQHHLEDGDAKLCLTTCEAERAHNRYSTFG